MGGDEWRWADPHGQQRRIRADALRAALASGAIPPNAPVWRSGWSEWQPAHNVAELTTSALAAANGLVANIPPPPMAMVAVQAAFEANGPELPGEEAKPQAGVQEPPPPPRYEPAAVRPQTGLLRPSAAPPGAPGPTAVGVPSIAPQAPIRTPPLAGGPPASAIAAPAQMANPAPLRGETAPYGFQPLGELVVPAPQAQSGDVSDDTGVNPFAPRPLGGLSASLRERWLPALAANWVAMRARIEAHPIGRKTWFFPTAGGLALIVFLGLVGLIARAFSGRAETNHMASAATLTMRAQPVEAPPPRVFPPCSVGDVPKGLAVNVQTTDLSITSLGSTLGIGIPVSAKESLALEIAPASLDVVHQERARGKVQRPTAAKRNEHLVVLSRDPKRAPIASNIDITAAKSDLYAITPGQPPRKLAKLPGAGAIEDVRAQPLERGTLVLIVRGGALYAGLLDGAGAFTGSWSRAGDARPMGLRLAAAGDAGVFAWFELQGRVARVRLARLDGKGLTTRSGPEDLTFASLQTAAVTPLRDGALVAWTQGASPTPSLLVQRLGADGARVGEAIVRSVNAASVGQPAVGVLESGDGIVAVARGKKSMHELAAWALRCPE